MSAAVRVPVLGEQQETQEVDHEAEGADDEDHLRVWFKNGVT